eukprot:Skav206630  [mRNA]  locus=scaffold2313:87780:92124:- [translate_table: standard]
MRSAGWERLMRFRGGWERLRSGANLPVVMKRNQLIKLRERVDAGEEENPLVRNFFADRAACNRLEASVALHRAANCHNFRQEVSETMAVIDALEEVPQLHVLDLCCGSGLTTCALALRGALHGVAKVTAVDRRPQREVPHFGEALGRGAAAVGMGGFLVDSWWIPGGFLVDSWWIWLLSSWRARSVSLGDAI